MPDARWKRHERAVARALGTKRLPNSGAGQPDCRADGWAVQIKTRASVPAWLWAALDQATRDAEEGERPAVVLVEVSQGRKMRRLVLLDFEQFRAVVSGAEGDGSAAEVGFVAETGSEMA